MYQKLWSDDVWFISGIFLPFHPTKNPKNQNFQKMKKMPWDIIILHKCTKNYDQMVSMVSKGRTDGRKEQKKWHIEVGAPPKNTRFFTSNTFITIARLKLAKNQANANQHPEAELLLFENYSHSSSTLLSKVIGNILKKASKKTSVSVFMRLYD